MKKKNIRKLPDWLLSRANDLETENLVAACVVKISESQITNGLYSHLEISVEDGEPKFPNLKLPLCEVGKFSRCNLEGKEIIHKELPKIKKERCWEAPNFGDPSKGFHDICFQQDVYQRSFESPRLLEIKTEVIGKEVGIDPVYAFRFTVEEVLEFSSPDFEYELFFAANLLQENVGGFNIYPANAELADYLKTVYINWEILPSGTKDDNINYILSGGRKRPSLEEERMVRERYTLLESLNPKDFIRGTSGFRRYFGARFTDDLVVFENIESGNALYVMYENWEELSKKSRLELLSGDYNGFERIIHTVGWQKKLKRLVNSLIKT